MKENKEKIRCKFCGRYYRPNPKNINIQKACEREICRKKRKAQAQKKWLEKNPDYYTGRYDNTREWRQKHPKYQKQWRLGRKKCEIQDKIPPKDRF